MGSIHGDDLEWLTAEERAWLAGEAQEKVQCATPRTGRDGDVIVQPSSAKSECSGAPTMYSDVDARRLGHHASSRLPQTLEGGDIRCGLGEPTRAHGWDMPKQSGGVPKRRFGGPHRRGVNGSFPRGVGCLQNDQRPHGACLECCPGSETKSAAAWSDSTCRRIKRCTSEITLG